MKYNPFSLPIFLFALVLPACAPSLEMAYEPALVPLATETVVPASILTLATAPPTRVVPTMTVLPATAAPARETATNIPTTIPPATEVLATLVPTLTPLLETAVSHSTPAFTDTLPIVQTPTSSWYNYVSDRHGLTFQYPAHWLPAAGPGYRLEGEDGFVELLATNSQDNLLANACQDLAFGAAIEWLTVAGQEACLIAAADGSQATLLVRFPELRENLVPGIAYAFLALQADIAHMPGFVQTLAFMPLTANSP